jgi:hypothetical protein
MSIMSESVCVGGERERKIENEGERKKEKER